MPWLLHAVHAGCYNYCTVIFCVQHAAKIACKNCMQQLRMKPQQGQTAGVVSNISQCQIALSCAIARGRSRSLVRHCLFNIYFFGYGYVQVVKVRVLGLGLGLVVGFALIIHTSCKSRTGSYLALRRIWHDSRSLIEARGRGERWGSDRLTLLF